MFDSDSDGTRVLSEQCIRLNYITQLSSRRDWGDCLKFEHRPYSGQRIKTQEAGNFRFPEHNEIQIAIFQDGRYSFPAPCVFDLSTALISSLPE